MSIRIKYTKENLETLTFATFVIGGAYWTRKYFKKNKNELFKVSSFNAVLSLFSAYYALSVNKFLLYNNLLDIKILYKGWFVISGLLLFDLLQDLYTSLK